MSKIEYCNGCANQVWLKEMSEYLLCPKCEAKSKRTGKIPTCGWSEPLKDRPKAGRNAVESE